MVPLLLKQSPKLISEQKHKDYFIFFTLSIPMYDVFISANNCLWILLTGPLNVTFYILKTRPKKVIKKFSDPSRKTS